MSAPVVVLSRRSSIAAIRAHRLSKFFRHHHSSRPGTLHEALTTGVTSLRGLRASRKSWALRDVSFDLARGHMVGIVGGNGAGKSTLLRLVAGVLHADAGRIQVDGRVGGLLELGSGFHPELTGRENIMISGVLAGLTRREVARAYDKIVAFSELEYAIDDPLRTYSTGMQMRLAFAVAIHVDADILLIDEVLSVGDMSFERKCVDRILDFRNEGRTIVLASHDTNLIADMCDQALWLHRGELVASGPAAAVVARYVAGFTAKEAEEQMRRRTPKIDRVVRTPMGTELRLHVNRLGSLELEVTAVRLLDSRGELAHEIARGDDLKVEIDFTARESVPSPIFQVWIHRDGANVRSEDTSLSGLIPRTVQGSGRAVLHLGRLDIAEDEYSIEVGAYPPDWSYAYDYHWKAYSLRVLPSDGPTPAKGSATRWEFQLKPGNLADRSSDE